ncbi:glycosyltransferase [Marinicrinis sediminis]|uniref:Glycosyltransferase n=1 Tax=Marinicrinis sediminis TaxID=1652465 RepID=A0ABW5R794_9BACL
MKIALAHFRVGETDGVSLEMEKWKLVLEQMGHEVVFLAGSHGTGNAYVIDELHYKHPRNNLFVDNAYDERANYLTEQALKEDILAFAKQIEHKLCEFITTHHIDMMIPNNIWSLGWGLPAGIAFTEAAKRTGIAFVAHHHDFYWERERYSHPTCSFVQEWLETYFPPNLSNVKHVVINEIAKAELYERRGIEATVVPNVFDFSGEPWVADDFNADFRQAIGVKEQDLLVLQATRITERKAIELGIDVVAEMQKPEYLQTLQEKGLYNGKRFEADSKIVYVFAGLPESTDQYLEQLNEKAAKLNVDIRYVNDHIEHERVQHEETKSFSLWDAYVHADYVTYPSILEGWGNQLLEAVYARKPMVIYEYPVYEKDIKAKHFNFESLGNTHTVQDNGLVQVADQRVREAAQAAIDTLTDRSRYEAVTSHNFDIGKTYYSYESLYGYLSQVIEPANEKQEVDTPELKSLS